MGSIKINKVFIGEGSALDLANNSDNFTYADGDKYVGKYKNGKFHGQGTYTFANGTVIEGIWENGKKVEVTKT